MRAGKDYEARREEDKQYSIIDKHLAAAHSVMPHRYLPNMWDCTN